jgi:hypothetical protein
MRPQPITTDVEYVLDDSVTMISKGDLQGKITCVNRDFVKVSVSPLKLRLAGMCRFVLRPQLVKHTRSPC